MAASIPDGLHLFVIGDVHGCMNLLKPLIERIALHVDRWRPTRAVTIMLGDYIDRGPASREVVECIIRGFPTPVVALRGNHEDLLLKFVDQPKTLTSIWGHHGGHETLRSYGVEIDQRFVNPTRIHQDFLARLPADHLAFFRATPLSAEIGQYFFCHAGVRPGVPLEEQSETDLLNIRKPFLTHKGKFEKIIVHGHTIVMAPEVNTTRINIDTGAYATGRLTCLKLQSDKISFI